MDLFFPGDDIVLFLCDRASKFEWLYFLTNKGEVPRAIHQWLIDVNSSSFNVGTIFIRDQQKRTAEHLLSYLKERDLPQKVKVLYADNAREHLSEGFRLYLEDLMIKQRFTVVENQRQNGLAEHNGGWRLMSQLRHDLDLSNLSKSFRRHALHLNVERRACTPRLSLGGKSPFEILFPRLSPPYKYFKTFGCSGSLLKNEQTRKDKCIPRAEPVIYIGTGLRYSKSGYLVYLPRFRTTAVVEHVRFDEHDFPARKQRYVENLTTALPGDFDPTAYVELQGSAPQGGQTIPSRTHSADELSRTIFHVNKPTTVDGSKAGVDLGKACDHGRLDDDGHPPDLIASDSEDEDDDADHQPADPAVLDALRDDVLRTLARRRQVATAPPSPGASERLLDRLGATPLAAEAVLSDSNTEAQLLFDLDSEPVADLLDELDLDHPAPPSAPRRSSRLQDHSTVSPVTVKRIAAMQDACNNSPRGVAAFDDIQSTTTRFGLDLRSGAVFESAGYLGAGADDIVNGLFEDKFLARVYIKALKACAKAHPAARPALADTIRKLRSPKTVSEALRSPEFREWIDAIHRELESLIQKGVFEISNFPTNRKIIPTKIVLKIKLKSDGTIDKMKARCCVLGFRQKSGLDYNPEQVYSPMTESSTIRLLLAVANRLKLHVDHLDIRVAFLNALLPADERFYCSPPPGFSLPPGQCWYMIRALYGAHQSANLWSQTWRDWLKTQAPQFQEAGSERCVYVFRQHADGTPVNLDTLRGITLEPDEKLIILVMNTDDLLILYSDSAIADVDAFEALINQSFDATPREPVDQYLGMHITRDADRRFLTLDLRRHVYAFIRTMDLDPLHGPSVSTPLDPNIVYSKADCPATVDTALREKVWSAHGKLIHLAIWGRPDIAHAVSVLGRYVHNPSEKLWRGYQRVARYLVGTRDYRLVYGTLDPEDLANEPYGFTDSDWGADLDNRRSTGAHVIFLDGAGVSWRVKLSSTVCLSTQEAEYCAQTEGVKEILNIRMLLRDLGFGLSKPTRLFCDNQGAITMSLHPANKPATRHMEMKTHFCRQHTELGNTKPIFKPTPKMVADFMTKQTARPTHMRHALRTFGNQAAPVALAPIRHLVD